MRLFSIPIELEEEEKTFGGVLTLRQVIYLVTALTVSAALFFLFKVLGLYTVINIVLCMPILMFGGALAFIKINQIRLDKYLFFLVRYYLRPRIFILKGDE